MDIYCSNVGYSCTFYPICTAYKMSMKRIDPFCLIHGKKMSEHVCLYCCLCFKPLTPEQCNVREDGQKEDVCKSCAEKEKKILGEKDG